ncbi:hypothetical protein [Archaeoglobus profundus]|uniref:Uncharacterized protein n=1 Tax=Archaeoglobus profundus (strain DSM 5631 / JCM 9629 / NBRC 100127 / Av18) TaxID=572546 RepID=D2RGL9_ARCPA|nr:hypothetical protein [Archaeoglobus profundus]ADB57444.1 hypothetical protein Arcpr_0375 [Archaeoglobus profundus DSM 5631]
MNLIIADTLPALMGLIVVALSAVAYSSLSAKIDARAINPRDIAVCILLLVVTAIYKGVTGILTMFYGIDPTYHTLHGLILLMIVEAVILVRLLHIFKSVGALRINRDTFEFLIYLAVLHLVAREVDEYIRIYLSNFETIVQVVIMSFVASITLIGLVLGAYLLKIHKELASLVDAVDVVPPVKTSCIAFSFVGLYGIHRVSHTIPHSCFLLALAALSLLVAGVQLLLELEMKYLKPLRRHNRI